MSDKNVARYWVEKLGLEPHPEGGWYKVVWTSTGSVRCVDVHPNERYYFNEADGDIPCAAATEKRALAGSIYFLLEGDQVWQHQEHVSMKANRM